jgi:hypothetical protein
MAIVLLGVELSGDYTDARPKTVGESSGVTIADHPGLAVIQLSTQYKALSTAL